MCNIQIQFKFKYSVFPHFTGAIGERCTRLKVKKKSKIYVKEIKNKFTTAAPISEYLMYRKISKVIHNKYQQPFDKNRFHTFLKNNYWVFKDTSLDTLRRRRNV